MDVPFLYEFVILFLLSIVVTICIARVAPPNCRPPVGFCPGVFCGPSLLGVVAHPEVIDQVRK